MKMEAFAYLIGPLFAIGAIFFALAWVTILPMLGLFYVFGWLA